MEEQNNNLANERMAKIDASLDEFEQKLGLPKYEASYKNSEKIKEYLEYDMDTLERLTPEQCKEISTILKGFAFHIQRAKNRETARITWSNGQLRKLVTPVMNQYRNCGGSFNHIFDAATLGDSYTSKVLAIRDYAQERVDRLEFLSNSINNKAEDIKELGRTKEKRQWQKE
jgi:hypothetical protein